MTPPIQKGPRRKAVWGRKRTIAVVGLLALGFPPTALAAGRHSRPGLEAKPGAPNSRVKGYKLDEALTERSAHGNSGEKTRVIVTLVTGRSLPSTFKNVSKGRLDILNGHVLEISNGQLEELAAHPNVFRVHFDRPVKTHNYRTSATVGAATVRQNLGYTGTGIGIAVIDSGIATWHDDLTLGASTASYPYGEQRVAKFVDFVHAQALPYDDNGHGSHVAGTIAGNGADSYERRQAGMAPGASLVSLKVLDADGQGTISNLIAALDWVTKNAATYRIRVVNMSVGASIHESYWTDPLTLAVKRVVDQGIVVVAAAGNMGKSAAGQAQWGAITAPGNAPWVLTVGASSTMGTLTRTDDTMASYSSRGPTFIDYAAKPDLVAPGTGTVSLAVPGSTFYATKAPYLVAGKDDHTRPYLSLSGTSMAAPAVSGSIALMLQANPKLTPNLVKAILQYTAQVYPGYTPLEDGAGFLNTLGAVRLARFFRTARAGDLVPVQAVWSRRIIWGNHMLTGGYITPSGNAWGTNIVWGDATAGAGDNIVWGSMCGGACDNNIVWGSRDSSENIVWGSSFDPNIVWGSSVGANNNIVWGSVRGDDNIVWGSDCGGADCDNIVWGSRDSDNIVWGSAARDDNIVWGSSLDPNIVWGSSAGEDVTWGTSGDAADAVVFGDDATGLLPSVELELGDAVTPPSDPTTSTTTTAAAGGL